MTCAGQTRVAARFGGGSYMSALGSRLHFGLGQARSIDRVEVTWPSGKRETYLGLAADTGCHLREGDPAPKPLRGFRALLPAPDDAHFLCNHPPDHPVAGFWVSILGKSGAGLPPFSGAVIRKSSPFMGRVASL